MIPAFSLTLSILSSLLACAAVVLLLLTCVLLVQIIAAGFPATAREVVSDQHPTVAVLMPAHDEASGIGQSVKEVLAQLGRDHRLIVIADNCSDDTAAIASEAGAVVLVRHDVSARGKSYALDFGLRALQDHPPDVVVVIDADCRPDPGALDLIARKAWTNNRPVQASYLMLSPPGSSLAVRFAEFAWAFKSRARAGGFSRLGLPCHLQGSGMAFPWRVINSAPVASGHIAEDLQLGLELALRGHAPAFCPAARVTSEFPASTKGLESQRTRWEHGHLAILSNTPRLLWRSLLTRNVGLAALAIDVCVPPLAFFVMLLVATLLLSAVAGVLGGSMLAFEISVFNLVCLGSIIGLAWHRYGRSILTLRELLALPRHVLQKLSIYRRFFKGRQKEWVRTDRK